MMIVWLEKRCRKQDADTFVILFVRRFHLRRVTFSSSVFGRVGSAQEGRVRVSVSHTLYMQHVLSLLTVKHAYCSHFSCTSCKSAVKTGG